MISPRVLRAGLVLTDPDTGAAQRVIVLQYNPEQLPKPTPPSPSDTSEKCLDLLTLLPHGEVESARRGCPPGLEGRARYPKLERPDMDDPLGVGVMRNLGVEPPAFERRENVVTCGGVDTPDRAGAKV